MTQTERDYGDRETTDEALCSALDDDHRETIAQLSEVRGQTTAGVIKAGVSKIKDDCEGRLIEFHNVPHARGYYKNHKAKEREFEGAYEELSPEGYYGTPAQPLHELLKQKAAEHREKAHAAARYLDSNDPETRVITNEYGAPEGIPQIDDTLEVQHGESDSDE